MFRPTVFTSYADSGQRPLPARNHHERFTAETNVDNVHNHPIAEQENTHPASITLRAAYDVDMRIRQHAFIFL